MRRATIETWMAAQESRDVLIERLEGGGLACANVETLEEGLTGEYAQERGLLMNVDDRQGGTRHVTRLPYRFSRSTVEAQRPAPRRGEHNDEVLRDLLALPPDRIQKLRDEDVLKS